MECPNCKTKLKLTELVGRSTNPDAAWYQLTGTELHCPECDSKVTYSRKPQIIAGIGAIIYAGVHLLNLLYPDNVYKIELNILGVIIFIGGLVYWHHKKSLVLVK